MMHFPFTYDMYDQPSGALLAQIELRAEVHGIIGDWFLGATEVVDLHTGDWCEIGPGSALWESCWKELRKPEIERRIDVEFTAYCNCHGEDGLLDEMERRLDHRRAESVA